MSEKLPTQQYAYTQIKNTNKRDAQIATEMVELFHVDERVALQIVASERRLEHQDRIKQSNQDYQNGSLGWE